MFENKGHGRRKMIRPGLEKPRISFQSSLRACASATES
jgi:hypothetical protein